MRFLQLISNGFAKLESLFLSLSLITMLVVAFWQVVMRNIYGEGYVWADLLVRILVLWVGLLGAALATHEGHHLSIDVVTKFLSPRAVKVLKLFTRSFALVICILLTRAAYNYILFQRAGGERSLFGMPAWVTEVIIPIAFALIAAHFAILILQGIVSLFTGASLPSDSKDHPV